MPPPLPKLDTESSDDDRAVVMTKGGAFESLGGEKKKVQQAAAKVKQDPAQQKKKVRKPRYFLGEPDSELPKRGELPPRQRRAQGDFFCDYIVVVDFEATCERNAPNYPHEIIEVPAVCIDATTLELVGEFQQFVRPVLNPRLSRFCKELTGIEQETVSRAGSLDEVLAEVHQWLAELGLFDDGVTFCIATDGPWDMRDFFWTHSVVRQRKVSVRYDYYRRWLDVRKLFEQHFEIRLNVKDMLRHLRLKFIGRPHCGLHDARNIARVAAKVLTATLPRAECYDEIPEALWLAKHAEAGAVEAHCSREPLEAMAVEEGGRAVDPLRDYAHVDEDGVVICEDDDDDDGGDPTGSIFIA